MLSTQTKQTLAFRHTTFQSVPIKCKFQKRLYNLKICQIKDISNSRTLGKQMEKRMSQELDFQKNHKSIIMVFMKVWCKYFSQ